MEYPRVTRRFAINQVTIAPSLTIPSRARPVGPCAHQLPTCLMMQLLPHLAIALSHPQHLRARCIWMPRVPCMSYPRSINVTSDAKHSNSCSINTISTGKGCPITTKGRPNHSRLYLMLQVFKTLQRKFHTVRG